MSDIHIGRSIYNEKKNLVKQYIYFHVPTGSGDTNQYSGKTPVLDTAGDPIPVSLAPGVTAQELLDIEAGILFETVEQVLLDPEMSLLALSTQIRAMWQNVANKVLALLNKEYKHYGTVLPKA
jgi:hypothetical protein